jgi:hypothetical protein
LGPEATLTGLAWAMPAARAAMAMIFMADIVTEVIGWVLSWTIVGFFLAERVCDNR